MRLFVCHSSVDKPLVRRVVQRLQPYLSDVWLDEREIAAGDSIHEVIGAALEASDCLLACISTYSLGSHWVQRELSAFLSRELAADRPLVIPLLLDDAEPTGFLRDRLQARLRMGESAAVASVVRGLHRTRPVAVVRASPMEPFRFLREDLKAAVELIGRAGDPEKTSLLVVPDVDGFIAAVEWVIRDTIPRLRAHGEEEVADRWEYITIGHPGTLNNLALAMEGVASDCALWCRVPATDTISLTWLGRVLDKAWTRLVRLVLLQMPSLMHGYSEVPLAAEHAQWKPWLVWSDQNVKTRYGLDEIKAALGLEDSGSFVALDLVGPGRPPSPVAKVWVQRHRVGTAHGPCVGLFRYPVSELFNVWLDECLPQIAARLVLDATSAGRLIDRSEFQRLHQSAYEWFGPS